MSNPHSLVGKIVSYRNTIGQAEAVEPNPFDGVNCLVIKPLKPGETTHYVPLNHLTTVREVNDPTPLNHALVILTQPPQHHGNYWHQTVRACRDHLNSGDLLRTAAVVRDLYRINNPTCIQLRDRAIRRLMQEAAVIWGVDEAVALTRINQELPADRQLQLSPVTQEPAPKPPSPAYLEQTVANLKDQRTALKKQLDVLQAALGEKQTELSALQAEYDKLKTEVRGLTVTVRAQAQTIETLENKCQTSAPPESQPSAPGASETAQKKRERDVGGTDRPAQKPHIAAIEERLRNEGKLL